VWHLNNLLFVSGVVAVAKLITGTRKR